MTREYDASAIASSAKGRNLQVESLALDLSLRQWYQVPTPGELPGAHRLRSTTMKARLYILAMSVASLAAFAGSVRPRGF